MFPSVVVRTRLTPRCALRAKRRQDPGSPYKSKHPAMKPRNPALSLELTPIVRRARRKTDEESNTVMLLTLRRLLAAMGWSIPSVLSRPRLKLPSLNPTKPELGRSSFCSLGRLLKAMRAVSRRSLRPRDERSARSRVSRLILPVVFSRRPRP
jgi:hypothetical protein